MRPRRHAAACQVSRLAGGLTVATIAMPQMASVSLGIWAGAGSRYEPEALNGASHFIEHMLFKGTRRRSPLKISQSVEGIGGYLNAFTSEENTCFYSKACHERLPDLLEVLADMYLNSRFDPEDIRKEREVIKEEVAMYYDDPQQFVFELLNAIQWPDQPLGRPITGTNQSLDRLGRPELLAFLRGHYCAANTLICAAGHLSHQHVLQCVRRHAKHFPAGPRPAFAPARSQGAGPVLKLQRRRTEQTQVAIGFRTCSRHDDHRYALRLLNVILGENMSSRLFQKVREDLGLAYSIHSSTSFFDDTGDLVIAAGLDEDKVGPALRLIRKEIESLIDRPPTAGELRRARDYVIGQLELSQENTESQMMNLGENLLGFGRYVAPSEAKQALREITPAQVRHTAGAFFRPERVSLALISAMKKADHLKGIFA